MKREYSLECSLDCSDFSFFLLLFVHTHTHTFFLAFLLPHSKERYESSKVHIATHMSRINRKFWKKFKSFAVDIALRLHQVNCNFAPKLSFGSSLLREIVETIKSQNLNWYCAFRWLSILIRESKTELLVRFFRLWNLLYRWVCWLKVIVITYIFVLFYTKPWVHVSTKTISTPNFT